MHPKRMVFTGIGVVAPSGVGTEEHWRSTLAGELRVSPIEGFDASRYPTTLAGQVHGFVAEEHIDARLIIQTDHWTQLGLAAAQLALDDAKYDPSAYDPYSTGVLLAANYGGSLFGQREIVAMCHGGPSAVTAYQSIAWFYAACAGQTSILNGAKGPASVVVGDHAGGLDSLGAARRVIRRGTRAALVGGTEAPVAPYALVCQMMGGRLTESRDPRTGYKPFDVEANGYAPGEGGALLMVEEAAAAAERGAPQIYAELAGYAATHDGEHISAPPADCRQLARAMRGALADASVSPDDVDVIVADGAGTPELDALEVRAIREVFGDRAGSIPVTAPQGFVGRLCAGGPSLNVATALLAMRDGLIPAVGNLTRPVPCYGLDFVREPRPARVDVVLVTARGYGGFNSSIVLKSYLEGEQ
ncbi:minimal PKS chain-length factor (CLF/KS beta) [Allocatelliglobosispora scoriae]|uniref:Minimal PKS chain-length factor (CLF/KS beta) n=1 Tax=Allocatelliglobosispora scoriae TaxID=643052 RepID=A0A841BZC8_9ACTN|nr:beta-ketoacyl synthase N-terminal-like domain-containing protein [Allocatelliglobosispora scoriae]MBB5872848.1 minimal PKS chain-length factor (CLF/KS beta) [Allocatelliglobosispora scoriae]